MKETRTLSPSEISRMKSDDLRDLVRRRLSELEGQEHGDYQLNPHFRQYVLDNARTEAAVLVPIVERPDQLHVILTRRMDHLTSHSGQIAFPGGKVDPDDKDAESAALREAREEISLPPEQVEIIARLPEYKTGSGYRIVPVIGLVDAAAELKPNPSEVDYVFEVPLSYLMDPRNHRRGSRMFRGQERHYFEMPFGEHYIWGITANMLHMMYERLFL
jgi:8-oxo-dGTP pyrophosphatase MutT (NUDIX family)